MSEDYDLPKGELMRGKRGLVMGVANKNSIAWGIAAQLAAQGAELVFTYMGEGLERRVRPLAGGIDAWVAGAVTKAGEGDEGRVRLVGQHPGW